VAFTAHCALRVWKGDVLLVGSAGDTREAFSKVTSVKELPPRNKLIALLRAAMALNEGGYRKEYAQWIGEAKRE
jgi:hypothetical protein